MKENRLTILFYSEEARAAFKRLYRGTGNFFVVSHPNYDGSLVEDRYLGCHTKFLLYLERNHIKDYLRLRQDVEHFGGHILLND